MSDLSLIRNWHEKAKDDYFSRYIFEYLSFEAFLKKYKYPVDEVRTLSGNTKERSYIQRLKNETSYEERWHILVKEDIQLKDTTTKLVQYLSIEPLHSEDERHWWGCTAYQQNQCQNQTIYGVVSTINDYVNMVEFWYQIRNNLFHASKDPNSKRDEQLVTFAYSTLSIFLEKVLLIEMEEKTMHPASWEGFEHRFFTGKAEATIKVGAGFGNANVYELLFLDSKFFPIILHGRQIDRDYVIKKLSFNLQNLYGDETLFRQEWEKISKKAHTQEQRDNLKIYFSEVSYYLKELITDFDKQ